MGRGDVMRPFAMAMCVLVFQAIAMGQAPGQDARLSILNNDRSEKPSVVIGTPEAPHENAPSMSLSLSPTVLELPAMFMLGHTPANARRPNTELALYQQIRELPIGGQGSFSEMLGSTGNGIMNNLENVFDAQDVEW